MIIAKIVSVTKKHRELNLGFLYQVEHKTEVRRTDFIFCFFILFENHMACKQQFGEGGWGELSQTFFPACYNLLEAYTNQFCYGKT